MLVEKCETVSNTNLGVARIGVEDVGEELACTGYARDNESVDVETIDDKEVRKVQGISLERRSNG